MYKVLIIEDEELIRRGLVYTIDWLSLDCTVIGEAADGVQGLQKIKEMHPDIVIADIRMPGLSGLEMIEQAKACGERFYAIILSSYSEFDYARQAILLDVGEYLVKPIVDDELEEAIRRAKNTIAREGTQGGDAVKIDSEGAAKTEVDQSDQVLRFFNGSVQSGNFYVAKTIKRIEDAYRTKITIEDIAASLGVSVSYLSRKIKRETNMTFVDLLNGLRIAKAAELLATGKYRMYEIAEMTGFTNYKYFCTVFKRYTGYAPSKLVR